MPKDAVLDANCKSRILLLGQVAVEREDGSIVRQFYSRRAVVLLARVAICPGECQSREELAEAIWSDLEPEMAKASLRNALATLRKICPEIQSDRSTVWIDGASCRVDVAEFEQGLAACARLTDPAERLRKLYETAKGAEGMFVPGSYDPWVLETRIRLDYLVEEAWLSIAELADEVGDEILRALADAKLKREAPALRPPEEFDLPRRSLSWVGREKDLEMLKRLRERERIVTIVGGPGIGKSRLALESAIDDRNVAFIALGSRESADAVRSALLAVVGTPMRGGAADAQIAASYRDLSGTLVLDEAEGLSQEAIAVLARLADAAPYLRLLITSRQPLGIPGERLLTLKPLALGPSSDAARLVRERILQARPDAPSDPEGEARLAEALEGVPLAIELAAAQAASFSLAEIERRIRVRVPADPVFGLLDAAIATTLSRLSAQERDCFRVIGCFRKAFSYEAVQSILPGLDVWAPLATLVRYSLIEAEEREGETFFNALDTVRRAAETDLRSSGLEAVYEERALAWYIERVQNEPWIGPGCNAAIERTLFQYENIRALLAKVADQDLACEGIAALEEFYLRTGLSHEAVELLGRWGGAKCTHLEARMTLAHLAGQTLANYDLMNEALEGLESSDPLVAARLIYLRALYQLRRYDLEVAESGFHSAREAFDAIGSPYWRAKALHGLGNTIYYFERYDEALGCYESALRVYEQLGDDRLQGTLLTHLAVLRLAQLDYERSKQEHERAIYHCSRAADERMLAYALHSYGTALRMLGESASASQRYLGAAQTFRRVGDRLGAASATGYAALTVDDGAEARRLAEESIAAWSEQGFSFKPGVIGSLFALARGLVRTGYSVEAARALGAAEREYEDLGHELLEKDLFALIRAEVEESVPETLLGEKVQEGRSLPLAELVAAR